MDERKNTNHRIGKQQNELLQELKIVRKQHETNKDVTSIEAGLMGHIKSTDVLNIETNQQTDGLICKKVDFDEEIAILYPWILRLAKWYCSSLEDAEDLAGDTICKILDNRDKFQNDRPLKPWCSTVLINTYFTKFKKSSLISFVSYDSVIDVISVFDPFNNLCRKEILSAIQRCVKQTKCMDCLLLHARGFSYEEIGLSLDIPIGTVRSRISFSRKVLARELNIRL